MKQDGIFISVQTHTELLKGYAHSGRMKDAFDQFHSMSTSQGNSVKIIR